jgi:hypothetical protein
MPSRAECRRLASGLAAHAFCSFDADTGDAERHDIRWPGALVEPFQNCDSLNARFGGAASMEAS